MSSTGSQDGQAQWWWSLTKNRVEHGPGEPNAERLGPFNSEAEASEALTRAKRRNDAWDNDPAWEDS